MKVSLNLIKEFVKINTEPEALGKLITEKAFEVEAIHGGKVNFSNVYTAKVEKIEKHPNADRLRVISLNLATKKLSPVVCGAWNFKEGDVVLVATPGAVIARSIHNPEEGSFKLGKATIRGVESQGMICSAYELGLSDELRDGVVVMPASTPIGVDYANSLTKDTVFDLALPANRPDLFSHLGVAREIGAILNKKVVNLDVKESKLLGKIRKENIVKVPKLCKKFYTIKINNVEITESPDFIQTALNAVGIKPINNIVDITNFVMIEIGQPLHAFDASKLSGQIVVKSAKASEQVELLNHKTYKLESDMVVLSDGKKTLDVAGIMGGLESEVTEETKEIILIAENFDMGNIRKTSKRLGLRSEAGTRFEKGLHSYLTTLGVNRAVELIAKHANGEVVETVLFDESKPEVTKIDFTDRQINQLLGTEIPAQKIKEFLERYGIVVTGNGKMRAVIPYFRTDITTVEDLAEEVLKLFGTNNIKSAPIAALSNHYEGDKRWKFLRNTKNYWVSAGFFEVQNYSFLSDTDINILKGNLEDHVSVKNPLSEDQGYMRKDSLAQLLKNAKLNQNSVDTLKIFEVAKRYEDYLKETWIFCNLILSKVETIQTLFSKARGECELFLEKSGITEYKWKFGKTNAEIEVQGEIVGKVEVIDADISEGYDLYTQPIFVHLEVERIFELSKKSTFEEFSRFQIVNRDVSVVVDFALNWQHLDNAIHEILRRNNDIETRVKVLDIGSMSTEKKAIDFANKLKAEGKKNWLISFEFKPKNKTLTDAEINGFLDQILVKLKGSGALIR